ncbi:MAG: outer membrane lipoprotein carrier protein LolA [Chitinophagaceae bacterium]|nr:outer membrane lipoprotein carrier protein LolA [Chitinophagaceae bacterium]
MKIFCILFLSLAGLVNEYQKDTKARKILESVSKKYKNIPTFSVHFIYILENKTQNIQEDFPGKLTVKGEKFKLELTEQEITNDGTNQYTYIKEAKEVTISSYKKEDTDINMINIFDIYKKNFKYQLVEELSTPLLYVIDLEPNKKEKNYFKIRIEINKKNDIKSFKLFDKNGNIYTYLIKNLEIKNNIEDTFFTFDTKKYKEIEIIDLR